MRRGGRQIDHRLVADSLVEALDDHRPATRRLLQLRQADDQAEPDEQREDEHGARRRALEEADEQLDAVGRAHASSPASADFGGGIS